MREFSEYIRKETLCDKIYFITNYMDYSCLKIAIEKIWR